MRLAYVLARVEPALDLSSGIESVILEQLMLLRVIRSVYVTNCSAGYCNGLA